MASRGQAKPLATFAFRGTACGSSNLGVTRGKKRDGARSSGGSERGKGPAAAARGKKEGKGREEGQKREGTRGGRGGGGYGGEEDEDAGGRG